MLQLKLAHENAKGPYGIHLLQLEVNGKIQRSSVGTSFLWRNYHISCTSIFNPSPFFCHWAAKGVCSWADRALSAGWYVCFSCHEALLLWWDSCRKTPTFLWFSQECHSGTWEVTGQTKRSLGTEREWRRAPYFSHPWNFYVENCNAFLLG